MNNVDLFMRHVSPEPNTGCWLWTGYIDKDGYGCCTSRITKRSVRTHRRSYELFIGRIPPKAHICHTCDVRSCVNPDHLYAGDRETNMRDMCDRRRYAYGIRNANAILDDNAVRHIRSSTSPARNLAERYNISVGYVRNLRAKGCPNWRGLR